MRTGENIYKRKDGRWEARYPKGRHDNGKIRYGFCYGRTYSEAKSKLEQAKKATTEISAVQTDKGPQFERICSEWLQSNRLRLKPSSFAKYQTAIERHINPSLGELCLCQISTAAISEFGLRLRSERGLAPKTVQDILILVHGILEYGAKQYPNTLAAVEVIYPPKVPQEIRVLSRKEQESLMAYLMEDLCPYKFGVLLALWTGMRIGEVCALRWKQINLQEKIIKVDATMQRIRNTNLSGSGKTVILTDSPKTPSSIREIPICNHTVALCKKCSLKMMKPMF